MAIGILVLGFLANYRALFSFGRSTPDLKMTLEQAAYDPGEGLTLAGLVVFVVLSVLRTEPIRAAWGAAGSWKSGLPALVVGDLLLVWAQRVSDVNLLMPALVLQLVSLALVLGGRSLLRAIGVPLLALVITFPLPAIMINMLVYPLQMVAVSLTSFLLDVVGRSHLVAGDLIITKGVAFQIIEGCSGLKSTMSIALAGVAFADVTGRDWREKLTLIAVAPFIGVLGNGFRVLVLVLREVPPDSVAHTIYGLATVVLGVVLLAGCDWGLSRTLFARWRRRSRLFVGADDDRPAHESPLRRLAFAAMFAVFLPASLSIVSARGVEEKPAKPINIESLPREMDGWSSRGIRFDNSFLGSVWFRHRIFRSYEKNGPGVRVFIGLEDGVTSGRSGYSAKTAIPRSGWRSIESIEKNTVSGATSTDDQEGDILLIGYQRGPVMVLHKRMGYAPWGLELLAAWLGLDRQSIGGAAVALVIRLETNVAGSDWKGAELRLRQIEQNVDEWARPLGRSAKTRNTRGQIKAGGRPFTNTLEFLACGRENRPPAGFDQRAGTVFCRVDLSKQSARTGEFNDFV